LLVFDRFCTCRFPVVMPVPLHARPFGARGAISGQRLRSPPAHPQSRSARFAAHSHLQGIRVLRLRHAYLLYLWLCRHAALVVRVESRHFPLQIALAEFAAQLVSTAGAVRRFRSAFDGEVIWPPIQSRRTAEHHPSRWLKHRLQECRVGPEIRGHHVDESARRAQRQRLLAGIVCVASSVFPSLAYTRSTK